jgi:hypothetical protein
MKNGFSKILRNTPVSLLPPLEIRNDPIGVKGRGYFASNKIKAGQLILLEERIEAESLGKLARKIVSTPDLSEILYAQEYCPLHKAPDDLEVEISDLLWSRAFVQASLNGYASSIVV